MDKAAQKRKIRHKLLEKFSPSSKMSQIFSPEFEEVMDKLKEQDDIIRDIALGKDLSGDGSSLKDLLKNAEKNANRREFIPAISYLIKFHKQLHNISDNLKLLDYNIDKVHYEFLFKDVDDNTLENLKYLKNRYSQYIPAKYSLKSEAGIMDFLTNIGTSRGRELAAWEKRYPKRIGKLKKDTKNIIEQGKKLLNSLTNIFDELSAARAQRNIDNYLNHASKFNKIFTTFDENFKNYYNDNIKTFLLKHEENLENEKQKNISEKSDSSSQSEPISTTQKVITPSQQPKSEETEVEVSDFIYPSNKDFNIPSLEAPQENINVEEPAPDTLKDNVVFEEDDTMLPSKHSFFYQNLLLMKNEEPAILKSKIFAYAKKLQYSDVETSVKLFKIASLIEV